MALFRPALQRLDQLTHPLNASEAAVAQQLGRLDDGWTVYLQPRLALDQPDFVAVHDLLGVCIIEVRDCGPDGPLPTGDDPRFWAARTRSVVYDQFFAAPSDGTQITTAVRAAVIMPRCTDAQAAQLLGTSTAEDDERAVEVWGNEGLRNELPRIVQGTGCAHPRPASIDRLHTSLVASEVADERPAPAPRSAGAFEIEINKQGGTIRRVRGAAGSGKSFGLAARAAHLAAQGKRVLVLSFNVTLANHLRTLVVDRCAEYGTNPTQVTCTNFHSLCTRIVQDAERAGVSPTAPRGARWTTAIVIKASEVLQSGDVPTYDAVLVDEGQDYEIAWWNLLRDHLLAPGGEMLLVVDPNQDVYGRTTWHTDDQMTAAGFDSPWLELGGSYRMPADLVRSMTAFSLDRASGGAVELTTPDDLVAVSGPSHGSLRLWRTVPRVGDIGVNVGREVVRLLRQHPSLSPGDISFVCEYHHDGVAAVREIEAAGYEVHHIFSRDPDDARRRRKYRFDPNADAITGSTIHSLKGWQTTALVVGVGLETKSKRMAYMALTRVGRHPQRPVVVSVISADKHLNDFGDAFAGLPIRPDATLADTARLSAPPPPASAPAPAMPIPVGASSAGMQADGIPNGSTLTSAAPSAPLTPLAAPAKLVARAGLGHGDLRAPTHDGISNPPPASKPLVDPTPNAPAISPGHTTTPRPPSRPATPPASVAHSTAPPPPGPSPAPATAATPAAAPAPPAPALTPPPAPASTAAPVPPPSGTSLAPPPPPGTPPAPGSPSPAGTPPLPGTPPPPLAWGAPAPVQD